MRLRHALPRQGKDRHGGHPGVSTQERRGDEVPAQPLIGKILYLDRDDAELEEGLYFIQDIIGLTVKDADTGEIYGKITDVYQNGASDVYSIKKDNGRELMFPCIDEVVLNTDIDAGEMIIRPLPGLFDDDTSEDGE